MRLSIVLVCTCLATAATADAPKLKRATIERRTLRPSLHLPTTVGAQQWAELTAPAAGIITNIAVDLGARVKKGQVLATFESGGKASKLVAPFDGIVVNRGAQLGAYVLAGTAVLFTLVDDGAKVHFELGIPEADFANVKVGQEVRARFLAWPAQVFVGVIHTVVPYVDARTHTLHADAVAENPMRSLLVGMSGTVELTLAVRENALVVPRAAVGSDGSIFRVDNGKAHRVPVTLGYEDGDSVEVLNGLSGGDQVVIGAAQEGAAVP